MSSIGRIRGWRHEGGVIDSADTPGGCWAHVSSVRSDGVMLAAGQEVRFGFEAYRSVLRVEGPSEQD